MVEEKSILIVDDEINLRRSLAMIINKAGHRVAIAADGIEALHLIENQPFDLVIIDLQLPDIAGSKLTELIHRNKKDLPIIILTAQPISDIHNQRLKNMIIAYLDKPIEPVEILDKIDQVFSNL